jgi:hypothetical protein
VDFRLLLRSSWPWTWLGIRRGAGRYSKVGHRKAIDVSGELHISANPVILRLIRALQALAQQVPIAEFAVIGGLAVMVRLQGAHRVTDDLDTVATQHGDDPTRVEIVTGAEGAIEGTKVDCIAVGDVPAAELHSADLPEEELDRAFVLSHRWALDTAEVQLLSADDLGLSATIGCRFASAAALVAMKLQSSPRRKGARSHKAGGDVFDIFRLISHPRSWTNPTEVPRRLLDRA